MFKALLVAFADLPDRDVPRDLVVDAVPGQRGSRGLPTGALPLGVIVSLSWRLDRARSYA